MSLIQPVEYVCVNCAEPGAVGEIHIYSAENEFERSLTILEALGEIFGSSNLMSAQESKMTVYMCPKCAEAISYMYQYYNNLLQLSNASGYICKLIAQIETWHQQQSDSSKMKTQDDETTVVEAEFIALGTGEDTLNEYQTIDTSSQLGIESHLYDTPISTEEVTTSKRSIGRPRTRPIIPILARKGILRHRARPNIMPRIKKPFGYGSIKERRLIKCTYCNEKFLMNLRVHEHILTVHENKPKSQCEKCGFEYYPELIKFETHKCLSEQELTQPDAEQPLICEVCGVRYGGDRLMMYHMEQVHAQENTRYKCHQCDTNTATRHTLHRHIERAHSRIRSYLCGCGQEFEQRQGLAEHLPCDRSLTCAVCKMIFPRKGLLLSHQRYKHRPPPPQFICPICNKPHFSQVKYEKHVRAHNMRSAAPTNWPLSPNFRLLPQGAFPCDICGKMYKLKAYLLEHMDFAHPEEKQVNRLLEESIKAITGDSETITVTATPTLEGLTEFVDVNGVRVQVVQVLPVDIPLGQSSNQLEIRHITEASEYDPERKYECSMCLKKYKTRTHLANHYKTHTGEVRNISCPVEGCEHRCRGRAKLEAHLRVKHPETIPEDEQHRWQCDTCGKFCISREHLRKHMQIHVNPKSRPPRAVNPRRYPCTVEGCTAIMANRANLESHISSKHPETIPEEERERFKCPVCNKGFGARKSLDRHKLNHMEGEARHTCEHCGMAFKRRYVLNQHVARKHGTIDPAGHSGDDETGSAIVIMEVDEPESKMEIGTIGTMRRSTLRISGGSGSGKTAEAETIQVWKCRVCQKYFSVNLKREEHMRTRHPQRYQ